MWCGLSAAVLIAVGVVAFSTQGFSTPPNVDTISSRVLPSPDVPGMQNPIIGKYLEKLAVLEPRRHEGLSIYPIIAKSTFPIGSYLTLDRALKRGVLRVTELGESAKVNTVLLENTSGEYIYIMSGEILKGAKQDRTMQNDLLAPPDSGKLKVHVFCTEHGRWVNKTESFEAAEYAVPNRVRQAAKVSKDQSSVWSSISENQSRLQVETPTAAAKEVYADKRVQDDIDPYIKTLSDVPEVHPRVVGVAATFGKRILAVDIFGDTDMFRALYPKLLKSYVVDVVGDAWTGTTTLKEIESFLSRAASAQWLPGQTDGVGAALEFHKGTLHGSALLYKEMLIHSDMFVGEVSMMAPPVGELNQQVSPTPNLQQRREQHTR